MDSAMTPASKAYSRSDLMNVLRAMPRDGIIDDTIDTVLCRSMMSASFSVSPTSSDIESSDDEDCCRRPTKKRMRMSRD